MSGVAIIIAKLQAASPLTGIRIMAGDIPLKVDLPAISVKQVSSLPRTTVDMVVAGRQHTDRVQVTVLMKATDATPAGAGYPGLRDLLSKVLAACPQTRGLVNGIHCDSIVPDIEGPDFADEEMAFLSGSRDFIVRWNAP